MSNPHLIPWTGDPYFEKWQNRFAPRRYTMGEEPGPVARRTVRYHRPVNR